MKSNNKSIMKKYFIIAATAIVAMAACSKVETVDTYSPSAISFSVVNHLQQTKATAGLTYPTSVPFGTFAWWTSADWTGVAADQDYVFMDNEQIVYRLLNDMTGAPYVWAPATAYYWTKTGKITFASYSPYTADGTDKGYSEIPAYDVTKGFLFNNYTILADTNIDLMYANLATNCTRETNVNGTEVTDEGDSGFSGVPTIFNHALCQIGFEFRAIGKKNPNVNDIKIQITDVDILNVDNKGSFTQTPAVATTPRWASDHSNVADYDYAPATDFVLDLIENTTANVAATDNYTALDKTRILLPQALLVTKDTNNVPLDITETTTTDQKLVVKYTIKTEYTSKPGTWATEDVVSIVRLNNGNIESWKDNQNITYRISINPYNTVPVTFDPAIVDWTDVYSDDITLPTID